MGLGACARDGGERQRQGKEARGRGKKRRREAEVVGSPIACKTFPSDRRGVMPK